jgi:beta-glucosidase/6-phospho-beta-glucosidase/beta-galactosidase
VPGGNLFNSAWTYSNLAKSVRDSSKLIRKASRKYKVGVSLGISNYYAGDDAWLSRLTARIMHWFTNRLFLNMCDRGLNWIGINYYFSRRVFGYKVHEPEQPVNDLGWYMQPGDIEYVIEDIYDAYKKPIIITESGVADRHDKWRKWWISESVGGIHRAMQSGAQVEGYIHWSLLDNFEWAYGKWPNFGLIHVDYKTFKRTPRQSAIWYSKLVKKLRGTT